MKLRKLENLLRRGAIAVETRVNRALTREFIAADPGAFNIETSSLCNLHCRFCAYDKKSSARVNMPDELFRECVEQALGLGFRQFHLTPCTGDVFMDRRIFTKLAHLDEHPEVEGYHFFTNLTIPGREQLLQLRSRRKLTRLTVSVYGHDLDSFVAITQSTAKVYRRLLANLQTLIEHWDEWPFRIEVGFRSTFDVPPANSTELMALLEQLHRKGANIHPSHGYYNNWGGYITAADVAGLNVEIGGADTTHKNGACAKLFDAVQVMASGIVNACSCRDVDATLQIGDIRLQPLAAILSAANPAYRQIIDEQQQGQFRPVCRDCDFYRSIYHQPSSFRRHRVATMTLAEYFQSLAARDAARPAVPARRLIPIAVAPAEAQKKAG